MCFTSFFIIFTITTPIYPLFKGSLTAFLKGPSLLSPKDGLICMEIINRFPLVPLVFFYLETSPYVGYNPRSWPMLDFIFPKDLVFYNTGGSRELQHLPQDSRNLQGPPHTSRTSYRKTWKTICVGDVVFQCRQCIQCILCTQCLQCVECSNTGKLSIVPSTPLRTLLWVRGEQEQQQQLTTTAA